jgi:hypothetical protein
LLRHVLGEYARQCEPILIEGRGFLHSKFQHGSPGQGEGECAFGYICITARPGIC